MYAAISADQLAQSTHAHLRPMRAPSSLWQDLSTNSSSASWSRFTCAGGRRGGSQAHLSAITAASSHLQDFMTCSSRAKSSLFTCRFIRLTWDAAVLEFHAEHCWLTTAGDVMDKYSGHASVLHAGQELRTAMIGCKGRLTYEMHSTGHMLMASSMYSGPSPHCV